MPMPAMPMVAMTPMADMPDPARGTVTPLPSARAPMAAARLCAGGPARLCGAAWPTRRRAAPALPAAPVAAPQARPAPVAAPRSGGLFNDPQRQAAPVDAAGQPRPRRPPPRNLFGIVTGALRRSLRSRSPREPQGRAPSRRCRRRGSDAARLGTRSTERGDGPRHPGLPAPAVVLTDSLTMLAA